MRKSILVVVMCGVLAGFSQSAFADGYDECSSDCSKANSVCIGKATQYVNDIEVQDAKAICDSTLAACSADCMSKEQNKEFMKPPAAENAEPGKDK